MSTSCQEQINQIIILLQQQTTTVNKISFEVFFNLLCFLLSLTIFTTLRPQKHAVFRCRLASSCLEMRSSCAYHSTHHQPVFARFIPLELKGDRLPLGWGLSSLKLLFSKASSLSCCLLYKSCDSSCNSRQMEMKLAI